VILLGIKTFRSLRAEAIHVVHADFSFYMYIRTFRSLDIGGISAQVAISIIVVWTSLDDMLKVTIWLRAFLLLLDIRTNRYLWGMKIMT